MSGVLAWRECRECGAPRVLGCRLWAAYEGIDVRSGRSRDTIEV